MADENGTEQPVVTTQRAYTLRLSGPDNQDSTWRDRLWCTHEAVNKGAKAFGDWLLTMRGGLCHTLAEADVPGKGNKPARHPTPQEIRSRRIVLALSWLSVESQRGAPERHLVSHDLDTATGERKNWKTVEALREILRGRGLCQEQVDPWVNDCRDSLSATIREDAIWVNRSEAFDLAANQIGASLTREELWDFLQPFFTNKHSYLQMDTVAGATNGDAETDNEASREDSSEEKAKGICLARTVRIEVEGVWLGRAEQSDEQRHNGTKLLAAGLENTEQNALCARSSRGAVAAPHLAGDHHGANGLFGAPVGGFQTRTVQESEQRVALARQMPRQALILRRPAWHREQAIHARFQAATGHGQPMGTDSTLVAPRTQPQRRLQHLVHGERKMGDGATTDRDHLPAAAQQMGQTALMHGTGELSIDTPAIAHQEACEVCAQHRRRLLKPAPLLNRIHRELIAAEGPHPPQPPAHLPAGFVRGDTGRGANLLHQPAVGGFGLTPQPRQRLAQPAAAHLQSPALFQHRRRLAVGQAQLLVQHRGQRHCPRTQLRGRTAYRIGSLTRMPALQRPPATPAAAQVNAKLDVLHARLRNLGLILARHSGLFHSATAVRTACRQRRLDHLVDALGNGAAAAASVPGTGLTSRLRRLGLGMASREGRRLALGGAQGFF